MVIQWGFNQQTWAWGYSLGYVCNLYILFLVTIPVHTVIILLQRRVAGSLLYFVGWFACKTGYQPYRNHSPR